MRFYDVAPYGAYSGYGYGDFGGAAILTFAPGADLTFPISGVYKDFVTDGTKLTGRASWSPLNAQIKGALGAVINNAMRGPGAGPNGQAAVMAFIGEAQQFIDAAGAAWPHGLFGRSKADAAVYGPALQALQDCIVNAIPAIAAASAEDTKARQVIEDERLRLKKIADDVIAADALVIHQAAATTAATRSIVRTEQRDQLVFEQDVSSLMPAKPATDWGKIAMYAAPAAAGLIGLVVFMGRPRRVAPLAGYSRRRPRRGHRRVRR